MKESTFLSLGMKDILKGLLLAVLTPVIYTIQTSIEAGVLTFDWHAIGLASLAGGLAYLVKNFFTKPSGIPPTK